MASFPLPLPLPLPLLMLVLFPMLVVGAVGSAGQQLRVGFYSHVCPGGESTVGALVENHFQTDPTIAPALVRMLFHDCFVRGCDASILLDSTPGKQAEKEAGPNRTVRGFHLIEKIKARLETLCPDTVSCSDVIVLATRDTVALAGGPHFDVPTGRRDGVHSRIEDVLLPGPSSNVSQAQSAFEERGLSLHDMVVLLGAHTFGVSHCGSFRNRLLPAKSEPPMEPAFREKLLQICGTADVPIVKQPSVFLDQSTPALVDNRYFQQVLAGRGLLAVDQFIGIDNTTAGLVAHLASRPEYFSQAFAEALIKMAGIGVLSGEAGEVRRNCTRIN